MTTHHHQHHHQQYHHHHHQWQLTITIITTTTTTIIKCDNSPDGGLFTGRHELSQQFVEIAQRDVHAHDSHHLVGGTVQCCWSVGHKHTHTPLHYHVPHRSKTQMSRGLKALSRGLKAAPSDQEELLLQAEASGLHLVTNKSCYNKTQTSRDFRAAPSDHQELVQWHTQAEASGLHLVTNKNCYNKTQTSRNFKAAPSDHQELLQ